MWFVMTFVATAVYLGIVLRMRGRTVFLKWFEWALGILGLLLLGFALQNYFASVKELEPTAPGMFLLVFGVPAALLLVISLALPLRRYFRASGKGRGAAVAEKMG